jgi:malonyl-CoA/methylmalonyl-CoA synthetase
MNLAAPILERLRRAPERRILVLLHPDGDVAAVYTRRDLLERTAVWMGRFERAGIGPDARIGIAAARNLDLPALHLAALAAGLAVVPINTASSRDECVRLLAAAELDLVVSDETFARAHAEGARTDEVTSVPWWLADAGTADTAALDRPLAVAREHATALVLYTSGTTGAPKSVPHTHEGLLANLEALATVWHRSERDRLLHVLPAHHFHGLVLALYGSLLAGGEIVLLPRFDATVAMSAIREHGINLLMGVPTMYARMLAQAEPEDDLSGLRLAISGSAPLGSELWRRFRNRFGIELVERYGLTETAIVAGNPVGATRAGSVGRALPGVTVAIRTDSGALLEDHAARGVRGEICVAGPSVLHAYGNDPQANQLAFDRGFFRTGDLGHLDEDDYLWIDGRLKDLIIVGGSNVVPGEVERALAGVDGVEELVVAGTADRDLGEVVACYFVVHSASDPNEVETALRGAAERGLAAYKRPRRYASLAELPRNAMGKVDRSQLASS